MDAKARAKQREYNHRYYAKHRDELLERARKDRQEHPEKWAKYRADYWKRKADKHADKTS